jgi:hypothetical protein
MIEIGAKPIALVELAHTAYAGNGEVHYNDGAEGPHETGWLALNGILLPTTLEPGPIGQSGNGTVLGAIWRC